MRCDRLFRSFFHWFFKDFSWFFKKLTLHWVKSQCLSNSAEAAPVNLNGPQLFQRATVFRCRIAFMRRKTITLVKAIHLQHVCIAGSLGDY